MRYDAVPNFAVFWNKLELIPRCIPLIMTGLERLHWQGFGQLTFFNSQENCHWTSGGRFRVANSFTNIFATLIQLNIGNFQTSVLVACAWWQRAVVLAHPVNTSTNRSFVTTLENDFTACLWENTWMLVSVYRQNKFASHMTTCFSSLDKTDFHFNMYWRQTCK